MSISRRHIGIHLATTIATAIGMLLSACAPALPRQQAEQEIGKFMLDYLVSQQAGGAYRQAPAQPWSRAPEDASLIVWAPPAQPRDEQGTEYLQTDAPAHVWWLSKGELTEVAGDRAAAIKSYREAHMQQQPANSVRPWSWSYTEFGILSLSSGNRKAQVYVGLSCGPLCGSGTVYTVERTPSGTWEIRGSEMKWIS